MKKLFLTLTALLLAFPAQAAVSVHRHLEPETLAYNALPSAAQTQFDTNENVKAVKYGSGVVLSSVTLDMSTTATGIITNVSQDICWASSTVWGSTALQITINDGTNDFTATNGAAGTGETLDTTSLVTDGGFDNPLSWTADAGWAVSGGKAVATTAANNTVIFQAGAGAVAGALYKIGADIVVTTGSVALRVFSSNGATRTTSGTYSDYKTTAGGTNPQFKVVSTFTGTGDNLYVKKVLTPDTSGILFTDGSGATFNPNLAGDGPYSITVELAP